MRTLRSIVFGTQFSLDINLNHSKLKRASLQQECALSAAEGLRYEIPKQKLRQ